MLIRHKPPFDPRCLYVARRTFTYQADEYVGGNWFDVTGNPARACKLYIANYIRLAEPAEVAAILGHHWRHELENAPVAIAAAEDEQTAAPGPESPAAPAAAPGPGLCEALAKRKRGRPRKHPLPEAVAS